MSVLGWILSGLLAVAFIGAGANKLVAGRGKLVATPNMAWATDFTAPQITLISVLEILGGLGVILPWLLNVAPVLSPVAALGCAAVMAGAVATHLRRHDPKAIPPTAVLFVLALAVAVIRFAQL